MTASRDDVVLVTGATGFIGSRVGAELAKTGCRVIGTDVLRPSSVLPFEFHLADVRDVARHADLVMSGCDIIVHCGGISGPMMMQDNPPELLDINLRGTTQLLSLACSAKISRFVCLSSVGAYGDTPNADIVSEDQQFRASAFYGTSKAATDLIAQTYAALKGLDVVILRPGWVYGPGRTTDALIQPIVRSARGAPFRLEAGGDHRIQFVHIDDVVRAVVAAAVAKPLPQRAYNINGPDTVSVKALRDMIARVLPGIDAEIGPGLLAGAEMQGLISIEAAQRDLGWTPSVPFATGLTNYVEWLQEHPF